MELFVWNNEVYLFIVNNKKEEEGVEYCYRILVTNKYINRYETYENNYHNEIEINE